MSTAHALLGLLDRSPAYGYSLKRDYDGLLAPDKPLAVGQVYSSVARCERQGWAEILTVESGSGPERKLYCITPDGVAPPIPRCCSAATTSSSTSMQTFVETGNRGLEPELMSPVSLSSLSGPAVAVGCGAVAIALLTSIGIGARLRPEHIRRA